MTPIIRNKEDRERVERQLAKEISGLRREADRCVTDAAAAKSDADSAINLAIARALERRVSVVTEIMQRLCGPTPKARKK